jgi:hypothetical protein
MKIAYKSVQFRDSTLRVIKEADAILAEYAARGIVVTLRQLYYQFVARDLIANKQSEYDRLGSIINDARLAGLIDWSLLQDRTRHLNSLAHWENPGGVIASAAASYHRNLWDGQEKYVEVWIEKDALIGVIETVCEEWDVPYFSCRGYTSQSEMWGASQRLLKHAEEGRTCHIIHLGDHDPSGKDMSRDIEDRITDFLNYHLIRSLMKGKKLKPGGAERERQCAELEAQVTILLPQVHRIALNMDQVREFSPPPNPAKVTDSRAAAYIAEFGPESWELDALDPDVLVALVRDNILAHLDREKWEEERDKQESERELLTATSENWPKVQEFVEAL